MRCSGEISDVWDCCASCIEYDIAQPAPCWHFFPSRGIYDALSLKANFENRLCRCVRTKIDLSALVVIPGSAVVHESLLCLDLEGEGTLQWTSGVQSARGGSISIPSVPSSLQMRMGLRNVAGVEFGPRSFQKTLDLVRHEQSTVCTRRTSRLDFVTQKITVSTSSLQTSHEPSHCCTIRSTTESWDIITKTRVDAQRIVLALQQIKVGFACSPSSMSVSTIVKASVMASHFMSRNAPFVLPQGVPYQSLTHSRARLHWACARMTLQLMAMRDSCEPFPRILSAVPRTIIARLLAGYCVACHRVTLRAMQVAL